MSDYHLNLSENEKVAKEFVLHLLLKGLLKSEPCDSNFSNENFKLPKWYDDEKFKRGQKYFKDNRSGIMISNLFGLFSLICEPNGAKLLDKTQQSSTPETAKKRYISTTLSMLSWYEEELKPGSKSWESLKRVRKMHLLASRAAAINGYEVIPQCAMAMTKFGFMGFALVKPHLLGIKHDNREDREGFVYFWAVIGSMLGIKDEFNMCLFPLDVVEIICHIFIRYCFNPFLQLETPTFEKLGRAFVKGLRWYIFFPSYESSLFSARRIVGIPGYQLDIDVSKEYYQKQVFTADELRKLQESFQSKNGFEYRKNYVMDEKMHILDIKRLKSFQEDNDSESVDLNGNVYGKYQKMGEKNCDDNPLVDLLGLKHPSELQITEVDDENLKMYLNDRKYSDLSPMDKFQVKLGIHRCNMINYPFMKKVYDIGLSTLLYFMRKEFKHL